MKYLRYSHELVRPILAVWLAILQRFLLRRLTPALVRLFPGPRGRQIIARIAYLLAIITQIVLVVVLAELVEISISIAELWTLLAQKHLEITL